MNMRQTVNTTFVLIAFAFLVLLTACDSGLRNTSGVDSLLLQFDSSRSRAQIGEPVQMRFTVKNTGLQTIVVESQNSPVLDMIVEEVDSRRVLLSWSAQNPDRVSHRLEWKPGESQVLELVWIPKLGEIGFGTYHNVFLTGLLNGNSGTQSAGVTICAADVCR